MSTCIPTCVCRCQQIGCGCRESRPKVKETKTRSISGSICQLCSGPAKAQTVRSVLGRVVSLILCPQCDTRRCPEKDGGCGHYEQDPNAPKCSGCGRWF